MGRTAMSIIFSTLMIFGLLASALAQTSNQQCEACGMTMDAMGQARFRIFDANGTRHYGCCPICALKLVKTYGELNITSFCDLNGSNYPITIAAKKNGSFATISPTSAVI